MYSVLPKDTIEKKILAYLDLSSSDLNGSHIKVIRGGEQVGYQGRKKRKTINVWMDSYKSLLNRFDTTITSWIDFNYIAFITIVLKKFQK